MNDQPGVILLVTWIGGQAIVKAETLHQYWRAIKADGFLDLRENKQIIPFHAVTSVQVAPPEILNQMQTGGSA